MKIVFLVALCIIPLIAGNLVEQQFESFLTEHGKKYTGAEYQRRLEIFKNNLLVLEDFKRRSPAPESFGVTKFFDIPYSEWKATYLMEGLEADALAPNCLEKGVYKPHSLDAYQLPDSIDWRDTEGVVTEVKDQGSCGSCWAFSTAGNIEGVFGKAGKPVGSLSPQQIVDCSKGCSSEIYQGQNVTVCNGGCNGGWMWTAMYDLATKMDALVGWTDYPYTAHAQTCQKIDNPKVKAKIVNYTCITPETGLDEVTMAQALVDYGPLSIALNANNFFGYKGGIFDSDSCVKNPVNHAVLLVGYGSENGKDFWIVKNSWGANWGESGYIRMARGKNLCGITEGVVTATIE